MLPIIMQSFTLHNQVLEIETNAPIISSKLCEHKCLLILDLFCTLHLI